MQKPIYYVTALLFGICPALRSQTNLNLPGLAVVQNSLFTQGKTAYLEGVFVRAKTGPTAVSDQMGRFNLIFSDLELGQKIRIQAEKNGFEVVNKSDLAEASILGRQSPLRIIMCKTGKLAENQLYYYNIGLNASLTQYTQRVARLKDAGKEREAVYAELSERYQTKISDQDQAMDMLEKERDLAERYIQEISNRFAEVNLDDMDSLYLKAHQAFVSGDMNAVGKILQIDRISNDLNRIQAGLQKAENLSKAGRERVEQAQLQLKQNIQNALLAARAAGIDFRFNLARKYYELAIRADTTQTDPAFEYYNFLIETQKPTEAEKNLQALTSRLLNRSPDKNSAVCWDLAKSYAALTSTDFLVINLKNARIHNERAIFYFEQYEKLFGLSSDPFLSAQKVMREAIDNFESVGLQKDNAGIPVPKNADNYYYQVVSMISALGKNDYKQFMELYGSIENMLNQSDDKTLIVYLKTLFADAFLQQNQLNKAKAIIDQTLNVIKPLYTRAPKEYAGLYAITMDEAAKIYKQTGNVDVLGMLLKADSLFAQGDEGSMMHNIHGFYYAKNAYEIGRVYFYERPNYPLATTYYEKSLHLYTQFGSESGKYGLDSYIDNLNELGQVYNTVGNYKAAINSLKRALEKNKLLAKSDTIIGHNNYFSFYSQLGRIYLNNPEKDIGIAMEMLQKAIHEYQFIHEPDNPFYMNMLSGAYQDLGICYSYEGRYHESFDCFDKSIAFSRKTYQSVASPFNASQLAYTLQCSGVGALMAYDPHKALKFLQESEQAYKPVKENYGFSYFFTKIKIVDALYSIYILDNAPQFRTKAVQQALDLEVEMMSYNGYGKSDLATLLHNTRARFDLVQPEQIPKMQIINKIQLEEAQIISEKDRLPVHQKLVTEIEKQFIASGRTDMNLKYLLAGARTYLSWLWLYKKEYARSEQVAREATQLFPEQSWYRISLAYSLLFQNKLEEAVESLMQIKDTFAPATGERLKNIILRDFDLLEKEGITHPDITKVKASLKEGN